MDMVNHPGHYISETGLETIDVIEAFTFDLKGIEATDTGNILKYMCRWKSKNGLEDLKKARWYLEHLIKHVEKLEEENKPYDIGDIPTSGCSGRFPWDESYWQSWCKDCVYNDQACIDDPCDVCQQPTAGNLNPCPTHWECNSTKEENKSIDKKED